MQYFPGMKRNRGAFSFRVFENLMAAALASKGKAEFFKNQNYFFRSQFWQALGYIRLNRHFHGGETY